ncbi:uncharacterized protein [Nicotiana tomentosiformis]|uniref:uncharacterized protein isoform X1 n=1 Tax=Nicotiana tomentosiformis TaxID=4098 RepID=UPI00051C65FD|nr:methyl-CpG-binding domain-containing protein 13 isoform X1 [Nicotiana tomentosiformis]
MGKKRSLPDWLPAGWKVEFRKGKKEKWYSDPSKGLKFCSKADVLHYLSSVGSNCFKSSSTKEIEKKDTGKVVTEKATSEGLPPGWIKEVRVRRKGHKIKKDPYYTDPVSGHTFRSMKEVSRFLETRESGRFESKSRDQCPGTSELGEPFSTLTAEADKHTSLDSDASGKEVNSNQKLKLGAEHMGHSSCVVGSISSFEGLGGGVPENADEEDDGKVVSDPVSGQEQEKENDGKFVSNPVSGENQEKPSRDGVEKHDQKTIPRKRKKGMNLPRRKSKRLAGIKADTSLQLRTNNQAHLATVRQEEETQAAITDNPVNFIDTSKHVATALTGITINKKIEIGSVTSKGQQDIVTLPLKERELPSPAEPAKTNLGSCKGDKKGETALESSLSDIWTDPCIEFAIKTLTGTIPVINEKKVDKIPGSSPSMSSVNTPCTVGLPSDEIWADPCFMFAVKTLTGEIPIGDELCSQKIVQQQFTSSQFQGNNGLVLPNIRFEEFGKANLSHMGAPEKALYKQQPAVAAPNAYQNCWFTKFGPRRPSPLC